MISRAGNWGQVYLVFVLCQQKDIGAEIVGLWRITLLLKQCSSWSEDLGVDGRLIFKWILVRCGLDASHSGQGPVAGSCEHGNEPSGCVKGGGISLLAEWLSVSQEGLLCGVSF
jgi:hypothetical protein